MFHSSEARPLEMPERAVAEPHDADPLGGPPWPASGPVRDQDAPLFALLRSTLGLPIDDPRWWAARPVRRPGWFASSAAGAAGASADAGTPRPAAWVIGGTVVPVVGIAPPTMELLERTLAGLGVQHGITHGGGPRHSGQHAQGVPQG